MRARLLLLAAAAVPFAVTAVAHGCSNAEPFESVCLWLGDSQNCFRDFREDMLLNAGASIDNPSGDCRPTPADAGADAQPTEVYSNPDPSKPQGNPNGSFVQRAMFDTCILNAGGEITFNPPIDPTMYPPAADAGPVTYTISFLQPDGTVCGLVTYNSTYDFALTINDAGALSPEADAAAAAAALDGGQFYTAGTYTQAATPGTEEVDVTCPSGETHHFNLNELVGPPGLDGGPTSSCPGFAPLMPTARLQVFLGGIDVPGAVSLAITYPPTPASGSPASYPDASDPQTVPVQTANTVVYFNCAVPAALELCMDGLKDGLETDIDCGGPTVHSPALDGGACPARCAAMQQCLVDSDCAGSLKCSVGTMGMKVCG